jgi:hypothetical protein
VSDHRDAGFPGQCCLCGGLVLGLRGEDRFLLPFELGPQWRLLGADVDGPCHLRCLIESDFGAVWGVGCFDYLAARWPAYAQGDGWRVHHAPMQQAVVVAREDGWLALIKASEVQAARPAASGEYALPMRSVVGYVDGSFEHVFLEALRDGVDGSVALEDLLRGLDVERVLLRPEAVVGGVLRRTTQRLGRAKSRDGGVEIYQAVHTRSSSMPASGRWPATS